MIIEMIFFVFPKFTDQNMCINLKSMTEKYTKKTLVAESPNVNMLSPY